MNLLFAGVIIAVICFELYAEYLLFSELELSPAQSAWSLTRLAVVCAGLANLLAVVLK